MLAGISTACFYPELTERALAYLSEAGVQAVEIFVNAPSELEDGYLRELRQIADNGGTRVISVHPFTSGLEPLLFFSDYRRRHLDGIELYKRYFHAANMLGAHILVFHGDRREAVKPRSQYFDLFGELAEAGKSMGVTVAQENVPRCASWCPQFFTEMGAYLPDARFVLDTKQCLRAGCSISDMADAMGEKIIHLHLSDHTETCDCLPVGTGTLDLNALLEKLRLNGFDGAVLLELYRNNYGAYAQLEESYRKILAAIHG
ncbi:sugar phosphate isomerase/epimerase [Oscillospiraceae bacterium PP1C4]